METKRVLCVGSNPSKKSLTHNAFDLSTKSGQLVDRWLLPYEKLIATRAHVNVYNQPTENNRPLKKSEIEANCSRLLSNIEEFEPDLVVAFGKTAATALDILGIPYYEMPHPSGLNRQLNDPNFVTEKLKGLEDALRQPTPSGTGVRN